MLQRPFPFTLVQIQYFTQIARLENMTAAADRLRVTQPTLSSAIKQLEGALGAKLFVRTDQNRLKLTAAGRLLLTDAEHLVRVAEQLEVHTRNNEGEITGELVVGVFSPIAPFRVPKILKEFSQQYPAVTLSFVEGNLSSLQRMIFDGACDVAILYRLGLDSRIQTSVLDRVSPYILLPEKHRLAQIPDQVEIHDLRDEAYIMLDLPYTRDYYLSLFTWAGIDPHIRYRVDSFETVRSFIGSEHGYTILHQGRGFGHTYSGGGVVSRDLKGNPPRLEVVLGGMVEVMQTPLGHAFTQIAQTVFADTPS